MTTNPRQMQPGVIVRVKINHNTVYPSKRMLRDDALEVAHDVREQLRQARPDHLVQLTSFPSADLEELSVKPGLVMSIEVRCVTADGSLLPAAEATT